MTMDGRIRRSALPQHIGDNVIILINDSSGVALSVSSSMPVDCGVLLLQDATVRK